MAESAKLGNVNVFASETQYETNKNTVGTNDLNLVPIDYLLNEEVFAKEPYSASSISPAVVVENYFWNDDWYRVYSDGWIEQGGLVNVSGREDYTITLHKPFITSSYAVLTQCEGEYLNSYSNSQNITKKTTTNFNLFPGFSEERSVRWVAIGSGKAGKEN